jgi:hypothetical protein
MRKARATLELDFKSLTFDGRLEAPNTEHPGEIVQEDSPASRPHTSAQRYNSAEDRSDQELTPRTEE